jgi:phosphoribosylformylglycinamidine synthase
MKPIIVILGPGTNCYEESKFAIELAGHPAEIVLRDDILDDRVDIMDYPGVFLPGGFESGDYFGSGRIAGLLLTEKFRKIAKAGRPIIGICNGFQILMEAGLFDSTSGESGGALVQNLSGVFEARKSQLLTMSGSIWTEGYEGKILHMPVAHGEGRWLIPKRYTGHLTPTFCYAKDGVPTEDYFDNPNGTKGGITGLANGLVMGMMPHPERAVRPEQGSTDGRYIFNTFVRLVKGT